jgi:hypothetical protein
MKGSGVELEESNAVEQTEEGMDRELPWLFDVLCYPASVPGLTILGIYIFLPVVLGLIGSGLNIVFGGFGLILTPVGLVLMGINYIITAYLFWYFSMCIRQSASGQIRAPETLSGAINDDFSEMALQLLLVACCVFICLGLSLAYYWITRRTDWICWLMLGCGVFLLPMALLATVMFGSFTGLNPFIILSSIFSTFFSYCAVVLAFCIPVAIGYGIFIFFLRTESIGAVTGVVVRGVFAYLFLVAAHILGRFYYRNEKKLYWEV